MSYLKKIDSLRAIAVLMVIVSHWVPKTSRLIPFGEMGVDIFFVISGFLITRILLTERIKAESLHQKPIEVLKNFVFRRALRIFPIYYFSLGIFWYFQSSQSYHLRENIEYYLTYTSNFLFFTDGKWDGYLAPLWSLAVEEQFYLIWPFLMIFIPAKHILKVILASISIGLIFPFLIHKEMAKILMPSCMTALGLGSLLAWLAIHHSEKLKQYRSLLLVLSFFSLTSIFIMCMIFESASIVPIIRILVSICSFVSIMYCLGMYKSNRMIEFIASNSILIFIGQISYGLYLYHNIISIAAGYYFEASFSLLFKGVNAAFMNLSWLIIKSILLLSFSWLSYQLIERFFLKLKKYFVLN